MDATASKDTASLGERFAAARLQAIGEISDPQGIGRLSERSLHRIVKYFTEPDMRYHEVKHAGFVCDIMRDGRITEIQTGAFSKLKRKLDVFLKEASVNVIYPLHKSKYIRYIDADTGEITPPKKSPKHQSIYSSAYELYNIREYLSHERLTVTLMFFESDEYKLRGIKHKIGRRYRGCERAECIPIRLLDIVTLKSEADYKIFLPETLPDEFCAADFNRAVGHGFSDGYSVIAILQSVGLLSEGRREGRRVLYTRLDK
ncbi:MAG: hypothetical protein J6L90_05830 [Clostridia bacterium]|nr:hypothetical protein [Clostridia bacterium]